MVDVLLVVVVVVLLVVVVLRVVVLVGAVRLRVKNAGNSVVVVFCLVL